MSGINTITVRAKTDGRGQVRPFGIYKGTNSAGDKNQTGAMVVIGDKQYKVTSSGRINIPKKIMEKYGRMGDDGRNRIQVKFATKRTVDGDHTQLVHTKIFRPREVDRNDPNNFRQKNLSIKNRDMLEVYDCEDDDDDEYSFS